MPRIIVQAAAGRSTEQKRALIRELTEAVCRNFSVDPDVVTVFLEEAPRENIGRGGILLSDRSQQSDGH